MIVVGLMSGTSMDGLDAAVVRIEGEGDDLTMRLLGLLEQPWPARLRSRLLGLLPPNRVDLGEVCALDTLVGQHSAQVARRAIEEFAGGCADLVVSHGQTVFHWIDGASALGTLQLGQPAWIVEATGLPVVSDLRSRDIAAGGHGAPLASTVDALWLRGRTPPATRAALNLGGIANVTIVGGKDEPVIAADTGPANCLQDVLATRAFPDGPGYDVNGALSAAGCVDQALLRVLLEDPYYARPAPKSTGREHFSSEYLDGRLAHAGAGGRSVEDVMATLVELTARTVADVVLAHGVHEVVASGGGVRNPTLMAALRRRLGAVPLVTSDELGLPAQAKEAALMALLGYLTWHGAPGVLPGATGSNTTRVLGRISPGDNGISAGARFASMPSRMRIVGD